MTCIVRNRQYGASMQHINSTCCSFASLIRTGCDPIPSESKEDMLMRLRNTMNWALLCLNGVLFVFLLFKFLDYQDNFSGGPVRQRVEKDAVTMQMKSYCVRWPFAMFVAKGFPHDDSFALIAYLDGLSLSSGKPMLLSEDEAHVASTDRKQLMLTLGRNFTVDLEYSSPRPTVFRIHEITVSSESENGNISFYTDENADGSYDYKLVRDTKKRVSHSYVFHDRGWCQVKDTINRHHKILMDGKDVIFDQERGLWRSQQ